MTDSNHLLFSAGGVDLAIDSAKVHCIHEGLSTQPEEGTHDWFLGLAVADQRLLPVTDLGGFLNAGNSLGRVIEVGRQLGIAGLKVDDVYGVSQRQPEMYTPTRSFASSNRRSLTNTQEGKQDGKQDNKQDESPLLNQAIVEQGRQHQLIDVAKLMQSSRFLNIKSTAT